MDLPVYLIDDLIEDAERKAAQQRARELANKAWAEIRRRARQEVCLMDGAD